MYFDSDVLVYFGINKVVRLSFSLIRLRKTRFRYDKRHFVLFWLTEIKNMLISFKDTALGLNQLKLE